MKSAFSIIIPKNIFQTHTVLFVHWILSVESLLFMSVLGMGIKFSSFEPGFLISAE